MPCHRMSSIRSSLGSSWSSGPSEEQKKDLRDLQRSRAVQKPTVVRLNYDYLDFRGTCTILYSNRHNASHKKPYILWLFRVLLSARLQWWVSRNATAQDTTSGEVSPVQGKQYTRFAKAFEALAQRIPQGEWSDWTSGVAKLTNLSTQLELVHSWVRLKSYGKLSDLVP